MNAPHISPRFYFPPVRTKGPGFVDSEGNPGRVALREPEPSADRAMTQKGELQVGAAICGLMAVALGLRWMLAGRSGFGVDEATFLFVTQKDSWREMIQFLQREESHPPLFYAIMRLWSSIAGSGDAAALALPVALGVALVPAIFIVGSSLFSVRVGMIAATLVSVQPALVEHSALVRPYSLLPLLALFSAYTLVRALQRGDRSMWAAHAVLTVALIYTHNWGLLVLGGQWVAGLTALSTVTRQPRAGARRAWCVTQIAIVAAYFPWAPTLVYQSRYAGHGAPPFEGPAALVAFISRAIGRLFQATIVGYAPPGDSATGESQTRAILWVLLVVLAIGAPLWLRAQRFSGTHPTPLKTRLVKALSKNPHAIELIVLVIVPTVAWIGAVVLSPWSNLLLLRCILTLAPLLILLLSFLFGTRRAGKSRMAWLAAGAVAASYTVALYSLAQLARSNAREIAIAVAARTEPSDLLIIAPEFLAASFNRYYTPGVEQINFPHFAREGAISFARVRDRTADPRALDLARAIVSQARLAGRRVWLITDRKAIVDLAPEEIRWAERSPGYFNVSIARTNQIRAELIALYGQPDTSVVAGDLRPRAEHLRALLFSVAAEP